MGGTVTVDYELLPQVLLWLMDIMARSDSLKLKCLSQACINWWTGVVWIRQLVDYCDVFINSLNSFPAGHPLTAEDQLVSKWCNAKIIQNWSNENTNSYTSWMARGWINTASVHFWMNCPFKCLPWLLAPRHLKVGSGKGLNSDDFD